MATSSNLGFPRIGRKRELKKALENYWAGKIPEMALLETGRNIRLENWQLQRDLGIEQIPSNDFSFYDHMLDMMVMLGAIPERFQDGQAAMNPDTYFAMARGAENGKWRGLPALEMTKWFNTNYHYLVPEISATTIFQKNTNKIISEYKEAEVLGIKTRPVMIGPVSFLLLSKSTADNFEPISKIDELITVYQAILNELYIHNIEWVQLDEPCLVKNLDSQTHDIYRNALKIVAGQTKRPKILLTTYFDSLDENFPAVMESHLEAFHLDLTHQKNDLAAALQLINHNQMLSLGIINGRNIWKTDFQKAAAIIQQAARTVSPEKIMISTSCSLLHTPQDLDQENHIPADVRDLLAFSKQKLMEIVELTKWTNKGLQHGLEPRPTKINTSQQIFRENPVVKDKVRQITNEMLKRQSPFAIRKEKQKKQYSLPLLPITTIGSFPQTKSIRNARSRLGKDEMSQSEYDAFIREEITRTIQFQEQIGVDVLVHGEYERNDMVQYFAEQMDGFVFTENGWVQSFGSRYVRPPIIYGDVSRPNKMTIAWTKFAQSQTQKPIKGMLTGPITILNWSFVRDDQPLRETCQQIALAIRDEVRDLEKAGIGIIQIDEPALREGLPLHRKDWKDYLDWAVKCFKICTGGVKDETQIHTHMCYSEFNDIIESIAALDADVISIEAARSRMELLKAFSTYHYPNDIGPGVYDIHSPHIPSQQEIYLLLKEAIKVLPVEQLWVNPDCGLKTRNWEEVEPALKALVAAAKQIREEIQSEG